MSLHQQLSIAKGQVFTADNKYKGITHQWTHFTTQVKTYARTLTLGTDLMRPDFQPPVASAALRAQILALETQTYAFVPPANGTQFERSHLVELNKNALTTLENQQRKVAKMDSDIAQMTISAGKIVLYTQNITDGLPNTVIQNTTSNALLHPTQVPSTMMAQMRASIYPQGSATNTALMVKQETESLPTAHTTEQVRENVEFIASARITIAALQHEHDDFSQPQLNAAATQVLTLELEVTALLQPPQTTLQVLHSPSTKLNSTPRMRNFNMQETNNRS